MDKSLQPLLSAIAAMSENRVIGKDNKLPWHLPADLKHFKDITAGHYIVMGRKTFESIGKPLPYRTNVILSRDKTFSVPGCQTFSSIEEALTQAKDAQQNEIFIIGGAEIYRQLLPKIGRLYLTIVHADVEGDAWFPELDVSEWKEISRERHAADEQNTYSYSFITLERK